MTPGVQGRLPWHVATVTRIRPEAKDVVTVAMTVPDWPGHLAGQHLDLRLTAEDGYEAQRSYSIASAPGNPAVEITVERVEGGEVSPFVLDELREGDQLELRGPIGGYFTWTPGSVDMPGTSEEVSPVLLVGGGSGVVPLMAMLRDRAERGAADPMRLLYSSRAIEAIIFRDELEHLAAADNGFALTHTLTRAQPADWRGERRRIDRDMLATVGFAASENPRAFVCGPTPLVEQVAADLLALGYAEARVKTERFGPSGGPKS